VYCQHQSVGEGRSCQAHPDIFHLARLAGHLNGHGGATDLAVLDGRVVALGGIGCRRENFAAMRALDLDFNEHNEILTKITKLTIENVLSLEKSCAQNDEMRGLRLISSSH
jgi:hypothetical protein